MKKNGFTLLEAVLTLTLLAGGLLGILTIYHRNIAQFGEREQTLAATMLAQQRLEQMIQDKKFQGYAYLTSGNYPSPEDMGAQGFAGFSRTTLIQEVNKTDLTTPQNGSGYKKITVGVTTGGNQVISLITLVTQWGEN